MSSTDNPPSLTLSDIMHHMSPSPAPFEEQGQPGNIIEGAPIGDPRGRDSSPEIYNEVDVAGMRQRLEEMGFLVASRRNGEQETLDLISDANAGSREKELLDMVIRLTEALPVDPAQLERQADTIANLATQRDFIALQAEEERERWRSERESWERTAEALLSQRNKPGKLEDAERLRTTFESENRVLRDKLQDAHRRLSSLESELMRLKPMLLMQPYSTSRPDKGKGREVDSRNQLGTIPEEREAKDGHGKSQYYSHNYLAPAKVTVNSPATASTSKAVPTTQPSHHQRRRSKDHNSKSKRQIHPLSSDAYTEHMLLAAKRIGRRRAAMVAGIVQHAEREKAALAQEQEQLRLQKEQDKLEQDRQERVANGSFGAYYRTPADGSTSSPQRGGAPRSGPPAPPRTPKRTGIHYSNLSAGPSTSTNPIPISLDSPLVYVNVNPAASQNGSPWAGSGVMGTPGQIRSALNRESGRGNQKAAPSNPPTPLASLLDAALMMDDEGRGGSKSRGKPNGKGRALEEPESPMPKRRKISSAGKQAASGSSADHPLNRVKSALDVLADQAAAAVVEPDQSDKRALGSVSNPAVKGKGKGKEKPKNRRNVNHREDEEDQDQDERGPLGQESTSTSSRGRARTRGASTGMSTRTKAVSSSASVTVSSRPVRHASRKRTNSSDRGGANLISAATRGSGRARGRPKGSVNKPRLAGSGSDTGTSQMISPPGPRVIAPPPGYSPLDEAMALSSSVQSKGKQLQRERSEEHAPHTVINRPMQINPKLGLRPVIGWGERDSFDVDSDSSPVRGSERPRLEDHENEVGQDMSAEERMRAIFSPSNSTIERVLPLSSAPNKSTDQTKSVDTVNGRGQSEPSASIPPDIETISPSGDEDIDADADAEADIDDDQDAEGEQEDDDDDDAEIDVSASHPSRSRSPPPPDPPPPGSDNGPPPDEDDEHDPDADAEGEMEFEENEDAPSGPTTSSARQASKGGLASSEKLSALKILRPFLSEHFVSEHLPPPANHLTSPHFQFNIPTGALFPPAWCSKSEPFLPSSSSTPHSFASRPTLSHDHNLSEKFEGLALNTSSSILVNASAKQNASQVLMLENWQPLVRWNKRDNQPSKAKTPSEFHNPDESVGQSSSHLEIVRKLMGTTSLRKSFYHHASHSEPPFSTVSPFIKLLEVVS